MSTYCVRDMLMRLKEVHSLLMQVYTAINPFGYSYISSCVHAKCVISKKACVLVYTMQDMFTRLKSINSPYSYKHNIQW